MEYDIAKVIADILARDKASRLTIEGGGGAGGGMLEGGGMLNYEIPVGKNSLIGIGVGGGGAYGSVPGQFGRERVREFTPRVGITYKGLF